MQIGVLVIDSTKEHQDTGLYPSGHINNILWSASVLATHLLHPFLVYASNELNISKKFEKFNSENQIRRDHFHTL